VIPDRYLKDGETVEAAGLSCRVIATPGHTVGSCCYYFEKEKILIGGDTLFRDSYGRTDLPTGDDSAMSGSVRKLLTLPDDVTVYTGHGENTTIGHEKNGGL
jgi:hydroxyacylglutathione hydrolase